MRFVTGGLLCLGVLALAMTAPRVGERVFLSPHALQITQINTGPFDCDGANRELDSGLHDVRLRKVHFWYGAYSGTFADIGGALEKMDAHGQSTSVAKTGWDRYAEPTGVQGQTVWFDFAPDWVNIERTAQLKLYARCTPLDDATKGRKAHIIVTLYYLQ